MINIGIRYIFKFILYCNGLSLYIFIFCDSVFLHLYFIANTLIYLFFLKVHTLEI